MSVNEELLREAVEVYEACGKNKKRAARELDIPRSTLRGRLKLAAQRGFMLPETDNLVPDGYHIKGTSTYLSYDEEGKPKVSRQWVKTDIDKERQLEIMNTAIEALCKSIPAKPAIDKPKRMYAEDLMACYPVGDHHLGMLAWEGDAEENYNLERGEQLLCSTMDYLVKSLPHCKKSTIVLLGDFLHYDSMESVTPSHKHLLDADSRPAKMIDAAMRCVDYLIDTALRHHAEVNVIIETGNHDLYSSLWLQRAFARAYRDEPRVNINTDPRPFHYFQHGKCLVGVHHGHKVKPEKLPLLMATDLPQQWGESLHRFWWTGHVHHSSERSKDYNGASVESFRILPPTDSYAYNAGYRTPRDMKGIVLHKELGEIHRQTVSSAMIDSLTPGAEPFKS